MAVERFLRAAIRSLGIWLMWMRPVTSVPAGRTNRPKEDTDCTSPCSHLPAVNPEPSREPVSPPPVYMCVS